MDNLQELTKKARGLEAVGQDASALEMYLRALSIGSGAADANLIARVGLLQLRLGKEEESAAMLSRASDAYEGAGLRNLALALSHRVLRSDPTRVDALRKVADLSSALGYRDDARRAALELADRSDRDVTADVLRTYLRAFPDDAGIKDRLTELVGDEYPSEPSGEADRTAIGEVSPSFDRPEAAPSPLEGESELLEVPFEPVTSGPEDVGLLEGLEPTSSSAEWDESPAPGETLPLLDLAGELAPSAATEDDAAPEADWHDGEEEGEPLPLLGADDSWSTREQPQSAAAQPEPIDPLEGLRLRIMRDSGDLAAHSELIGQLDAGDSELLEEALSDAHPAFAAAGDFTTAADHAARLAELRPEDGGLLQTWAEYAFRSGDRQRLIAAYLAVARRLTDAGEREPAKRIYDRVLKLDPKNLEALAATDAGKQAAKDEFVDFGALVLDEEQEASTRFTVAPEFPTGDEQKDFEEILSAFREQIASGIDADDSTSHYDLGIAFKEMGLWDDAVTQFQRALRAGSNTLATLELLGECYVEKGEHERATRILHRAVELPGTPERDLIGVYYWLGRAQEASGAALPARQSYGKVAAIDPVFRDTVERLERLAPR